jgi:peptidoglycan/LPS O-acetylase OafA/YrhL
MHPRVAATSLAIPECAGPVVAPKLIHLKQPWVARSAQTGTRIPALDGLRGVAILLVLLRHSVAGTEINSHVWNAVLVPLRLSWSGVDLFFVLSGFLIGGILLNARESRNYFRTFYIRRAFRILPVYCIFLALYLGRHVVAYMFAGHFGSTSPLPVPWFSFLTFTQNLWMVAFGWFGPMAIAPTWSLAVEEQFYLTVPFLIRRMRTQTLFAVLICIIIGAPILRGILPYVLTHGDFGTYVLMPCRADALALGVLGALAFRSARFRQRVRNSSWLVYSLVGVTFIGVAFLTIRGTNQYSPPTATWGLSCLALFYASILMIAVCKTGGILERVLSLGVLRRLGAVAYCTYLIHEILIVATRGALSAHTDLSRPGVWAIGGVLGVSMALAIASLSWKFLEKPLLRRGHKYQY